MTPIPHSRPWIDCSDLAMVDATMRSGFLADGQQIVALEGELANYLQAPSVRVTASGTIALALALKSLSLASNSEVLVPTYVCRSVEQAVRLAGARPVFVDSGSHWTISPSDVSAKRTNRTRALIAVHTFGIAADMLALQELGIPILEDACQSFGLQLLGRQAGTIGAFGVFSMHATKCFTAGIGGAVTSSDERLMHRFHQLQAHSMTTMPISDLDASLGLSQLRRYDAMLSRRVLLANRYLSALSELPVELPRGLNSMFFRFPIRLRRATYESMMPRFAAEGVAVRRGVDELLHRR